MHGKLNFYYDLPFVCRTNNIINFPVLVKAVPTCGALASTEKSRQDIHNAYQLILELNKLKLVFRKTTTNPDRKESTAEHSWSASMIVMILLDELKKEFTEINELKAIKLALIHDVVEVYAGDVMAFDIEARKENEKVEREALEKLMAIYPVFGKQLQNLHISYLVKPLLLYIRN